MCLLDCSIEALERRAAELDAKQSDIELPPPEAADSIPTPKSVTFIDYDDPFSFVERSFGAPHISKLSRLAWVGCGGDIYVLECMGKGHIRLERLEDPEGTLSCRHSARLPLLNSHLRSPS